MGVSLRTKKSLAGQTFLSATLFRLPLRGFGDVGFGWLILEIVRPLRGRFCDQVDGKIRDG